MVWPDVWVTDVKVDIHGLFYTAESLRKALMESSLDVHLEEAGHLFSPQKVYR